MSKLFLIQSDFACTPQAIEKLKNIYSPQDTVILMGEAVQFITDEFLQSLENVYLLETDAENLAPHHIPHLDIISYQQFADICLQHTRCISLK
jgi:sulfur transfer complex TusBCD TusB component (DsrH family)